MKIYWTLKSIPELSHLPLKERVKRWRCAYRKTFRHPETWAGLVLFALFCGVGSHFFGGFGSVVMAGTGGFIYSQVVTYVVQKYYHHCLTGILNREIPGMMLNDLILPWCHDGLCPDG